MRVTSISTIKDYLQNIGEYIDIKGNEIASINGFSSLFDYRTETITFLAEERELTDELILRAGVISLIITGSDVEFKSNFRCQISVKNTRHAFFSVIDEFFSEEQSAEVTMISSDERVYGTNSHVSSKAQIGKNVRIGVGCVIEGDVSIGDDTEIHHNVIIRRNTKIGKHCTIFSGAIIGERGFNYTLDKDGVPCMIKHYGGVTIEDDVHIGDNCCIVQGVIDDTLIRSGAKLNTMVHVAHNVRIGKNTRITSPVHICGSVVIGDGCHIAALIIRNQVNIGKNATLGLGSVVVKDVEDGVTVIGVPAKPMEGK